MKRNTVWVARVLTFIMFFQTVSGLPVFQTIAMAAEAVGGIVQEEMLEESDGEQTDLQQELSESDKELDTEEDIISSSEETPTTTEEKFIEVDALSESVLLRTEDVAYQNLMTELDTGVSYSKLSEDNKVLLGEYFLLSDKAIKACEEAGLSVQEVLSPAMIISRLDVSLEQANTMVENYIQLEGEERGERRAVSQAESYVEYMEAYSSISKEGQVQIRNLVMDGYKASAAVYAYIASKALEADINTIIWTKSKDGKAIVDLSTLSKEDAEELTATAGIYSVKLDFLFSYMTEHGLTVEQLSNKLKNCQMELDIFVSHGEAGLSTQAFSSPIDEETTKDHPIAPFSYEYGENESINLNNGELSYYDPIVNLAGKNGLDLNISLVYNSSDAMLDKAEQVLKEPSADSWMVKGKVEISSKPRDPSPTVISKLYIAKDETYAVLPAFRQDYTPIYYYVSKDEKWVQSFKGSSVANGFVDDDLDDLMVKMPTSNSYTEKFKSSHYMAGLKYKEKYSYSSKPYDYEYYFDMHAELLTQWQYKDVDYEEKTVGNPFVDMGVGWGLNFSRVILEPRSNKKYIQLGTGETHELVLEGGKYILKDTPNEYLLTDLAFANATTADKNKVPGSYYVLTYVGRDKAGQKEYFDQNGFLLAIIDRFDNKISFKLTSSVGITGKDDLEITDTIGRKVTFKYSAVIGEHVLLDVTLPDSSVINYYGTRVDSYTGLDGKPYGNSDVEYSSIKFLLRKKTDAQNNITEYGYNTDPVATKNADEAHRYFYFGEYPKVSSSTGHFVDNSSMARSSVFNLTQVFHPTGAASLYEYNVIAAPLSGGGRTIYAVVLRKNDNPNTAFEQTYKYCLEDSNNSYNYKTTVTSELTNVITEHTFNEKGYRIETLIRSGSTKHVSTKYEYTQANYNLPQKISTTWFNSNQSNQLVTNELFEYDSRGNLTNSTDIAGVKSAYTYDPTYNMVTLKTSKNGTVEERLTLTGDKKQVSAVEIWSNNQNQGKTSYVYNTDKTLKQQTVTPGTSASPIVTSYTYNRAIYVASQTTSGVTARFTYDTMGRVLTAVDGKSQTVRFAYDKIGRQVLQTNPDGTTQQTLYDDKNNMLTITDENGNKTQYRYDTLGYLTSVWDMTGNLCLQRLAYDRERNLTSETDANGNVTSYSYDKLARLTNKEVKKGTTVLYSESYQYDDAFGSTYNKVTKTVAGDSNSPSIISTSYTNNKGQLAKDGVMSGGTELVTTYRYNGLGYIQSDQTAKDAAAGLYATNLYEYDYAGRVTGVTTSDSAKYTTTYDMLGNKLSITDPKGNTTLYTYDDFGRVTEEKTPFEGASYAAANYIYDANGNVISQTILTNKPGESTSTSTTDYEYNNRNFLTKTTTSGEATGSSYVTYTYDNVGNMKSMTTGNGANTTSYNYDRLSRLVSMIDPLGQSESYTYDNNSNLIKKTDRNGITTTNIYNGLNLLTEVSTNGGDSMSYSYAATGAKLTESNGTVYTTNQYDDRGLLIKQTETSTGLTVVKDYTYDLAGNRLSFKLTKNGAQELLQNYVYDDLNRLVGVEENNKTVAEYAYDRNGNRTSLSYDNGVTTSYAYNNANLVTSLTNNSGSNVVSGYTYTYYLDGNQATKSENTGKTTSYDYDGLGRLVSEAESGTQDPVTKTYGYDTSGNRATLHVTGEENYVTSYTYDKNNRLITEVAEYDTYESTKKYTYDPNGNQLGKFESVIGEATSDITSEVTSDIISDTTSAISETANDITSEATSETTSDITSDTTKLDVYQAGVAVGDKTYEMEINEYDTFNRLIKTITNTATAEYTYKPDGLRYSKTVDDQTTIHVWDGGNIVVEVSNDGNTIDTYIRGINLIKSNVSGYYIYNAHGDVVELTDSNGAVLKDYVYDAFGVEVNPDDNDNNAFRYSGEYFDKETGNVYLRARYYSPATGRFTSEDPIGAGLNWYTYCNGNPIMFVDPNGLDTDAAGLSISGALLGRVSLGIFGVKDDEGNIGIMFTLGGGIGTPSLGLEGVRSSSDAFEIVDLIGQGQGVGGNVSKLGVDVSTGKDRNGNEVSSTSASLSLIGTDDLAGEIHTEINVTGVIKLFNYKDAIKTLGDFFGGNSKEDKVDNYNEPVVYGPKPYEKVTELTKYHKNTTTKEVYGPVEFNNRNIYITK